MSYLAFTEDRIHEPAVNHQLKRNSPDFSPNEYRFGRMSGKRAGGYTGRAAHRVRGFFSMMLQLITAAKMRRIERELRMHGIRYESVKLKDDRFVAN